MTFSNNSLNLTLPEPDLLLDELSTHVDFISAGTVGSLNVKGIAFNAIASGSLAGSTVTLSAYSGVKFDVDEAYDGEELGIILEDNTVSLFTATTAFGETSSQNLTAASTDHSYPELRRLVRQGMI